MRPALFLLIGLMVSTGVAGAQDRTTELGQLKQEILKQQQALQQQLDALSQLLARVAALEQQPATAPAGPAVPPTAPLVVTTPDDGSEHRDPVGDLNAERIASGEMPGGVVIPARNLTLALGAMVKTQLFYDTNAEGRGPVFLPAFLGAGRDDRDGTAAMSAQLSRLDVEGRTQVGETRLRGYLEYDFAGIGDQFNLRHAYMTVDRGASGRWTVGKTWSNLMDMQALPEGLTEPTFSGGIFARQAQFRYARAVNPHVRWTASLEDPASNDITPSSPVPTRTAWPDAIAAVTVSGARAHVRVAGLVRRITIDPDGQDDYGVTGWGVHTSGHLAVTGATRLIGTVAVGDGMGRYLLGLLPGDAAFVDTDARQIDARRNFGVVGGLRHRWNPSCRTNAGVGYANAETGPLQTDAALRASLFGLANFICSVNPFITLGGEYQYGRRWNKVGDLDNHRFLFGMQIF